MRKYFPIYKEAVSHIWLCNCSNLNFLKYEETFILFFITAADPLPTVGVVIVSYQITLQLRWSNILRPASGIERWAQWEATHHGSGRWYHTPPWPLPAVRDLTRDCRLSTSDESVPKLSKVSFRGKCVHLTPSKATIINKTRPAGHFPPASQVGRLARTVFCTISFLWGVTMNTSLSSQRARRGLMLLTTRQLM